MQKAENVNCSPKLPVKTKWVFMVTSSESTCFFIKVFENHFCSKTHFVFEFTSQSIRRCCDVEKGT